MVNETGTGGGQQELQAPQPPSQSLRLLSAPSWSPEHQASVSSKSVARAPDIFQLQVGPHSPRHLSALSRSPEYQASCSSKLVPTAPGIFQLRVGPQTPRHLSAPSWSPEHQASCSSESVPRASGILQLRVSPHVSFSDPRGTDPAWKELLHAHTQREGGP